MYILPNRFTFAKAFLEDKNDKKEENRRQAHAYLRFTFGLHSVCVSVYTAPEM